MGGSSERRREMSMLRSGDLVRRGQKTWNFRLNMYAAIRWRSTSTMRLVGFVVASIQEQAEVQTSIIEGKRSFQSDLCSDFTARTMMIYPRKGP